MSGYGEPTLRRRFDRFVLRVQGRLDGERADQIIPWAGAVLVAGVFLALAAARLRSLEGGSGLAPWLQASWRRGHGMAGDPVAGVDPARGSWSLVGELVLWATRRVPAEATFALVQAAAIGLAVIPLWRTARNEAHLRVGAATVVVAGFALAPTLHRANLTPFHPELVALPALLWAYLFAMRERWWRFAVAIAVVLACRADLGLTVVLLGIVLASHGQRRPGAVTALVGLAWTIAALVVLAPELPDEALPPAGEFVARSTTPLAVIRDLWSHPVDELRAVFAEPSVLFLVVVLAPLLFLPLLSPRKLAVAAPGLVLAMLADRAVQVVAQRGVLNLSPAAAHIGPAMAFVFVALVFSLERIGTLSVTRVNVDRRVLLALLAGSTLFFLTEAPTTPYRKPWAWGSQDAVDGARLDAADSVDDGARVAASPTVISLVAERAHLTALPSDPADLTARAVARATPGLDVVVLDTSALDPVTGEAVWTDTDRTKVVDRFGTHGFTTRSDHLGVLVLARSDDG